MRIASFVTLALLLAGCTQGTPSGPEDEFVSCPSWIKYPHNGQIIEGNLQWTNMSTNPADLTRWDFRAPTPQQAGVAIGDGNLLSYNDHPLDQVVFDFHYREKAGGEPRRLLYVQDGELHARFFESVDGQVGEPLEAYDEARGKGSAQHEWTFRSDEATKWSIHNVTLRIDLAADDADPAPRGVFVQWELSPDHDGDPNTASVAAMHYAPEFWYRTCSRDT